MSSQRHNDSVHGSHAPPPSRNGQSPANEAIIQSPDREPIPSWDGSAFWYCGQLLHRFKQPAPNLRAFLDACEEQRWEGVVHDPLSPKRGATKADIQHRFHDMLQDLNALLPPGTIIFHGDGTGQGAYWERVDGVAPRLVPAKRARRREKSEPSASRGREHAKKRRK
jgi:hypothetical protein